MESRIKEIYDSFTVHVLFLYQGRVGGPAFTHALCETTTHLIACLEDASGIEVNADNNCDAVQIDANMVTCSDPDGT